MTADKLEVLVSVPGEAEAAAIVNALADGGIEAQATGGFLSGFKAEAPGEVRVLVEAADAARARELLSALRTRPAAGEQDTGPIEFECESCQQRVVFPAETRGSIQTCPECGEWLDVPGGADVPDEIEEPDGE